MFKKLSIFHACLFLLQYHGMAQNVGIGTSSPNANALLHVELGASTTKGLLVTGGYNPASLFPIIGAGSRLMYYPGKAAFRVGNVAGTQWDNSNTGLNSVATGFNTIASGEFSTAFGSNTIASGPYSTASGSGSVASGQTSTALGYGNTASGLASTAMGFFSIAKGYASTVAGVYNDPILASDETSVSSTTPLFIVGNGDNNNRSNAMVVRKDGNVGIGTNIPLARLHIDLQSSQANGFLVSGMPNDNATVPSLGEGSRMMFYPGKSAFRAGYVEANEWDNGNIGQFSSAMGVNTKATGEYSTAVNLATNAIGAASFATGQGTQARGTLSATFGFNTIAKGYASTVVGVHNDPILASDETLVTSTTPLFIVGNGNTSIPSNAMVVRKDGNVGIGTSAPGYLLDVAGRMRLRSIGGAFTAGMYLNKGDNSVERAFVGMQSDDYVGLFGVPLNKWGFVMNTNNGQVGINNTSPQALLHIIRGAKTNGSYLAASALIVEGDQGGWIQLSNNNNIEGGIISGNQQTSIRSAIIFGTDSSLLFRTGGNVSHLVIDKTGNAIVSGELRRPATGSANLVPLAYGVVNVAGDILSGTGNFTIERFGNGEYRLDIAGEAKMDINIHIVQVTPVGDDLCFTTVTNSGGSSLHIKTYNQLGVRTDNGFHFVVYKP